MACTTLAAYAAVEKGRTMPVVPRMEMPPMMPRRALVVFSAIFSPPGTLMTTRTPRSSGVEDLFDGVGDHRLGTSFMAGPPRVARAPAW